MQMVERTVIGDEKLHIDIRRAGITLLSGLPSVDDDDDPINQTL